MKYRVLRSTWILFAMFSLLTACKKDSQDAYGDGDMSFLPLSEEMNIHPLGDVITVTYTSEHNWKMKFDGSDQMPSWIALSSTSGSAGTVNLDFVVSPNLSGRQNIVKITFRSINSGQTLDECTIIQQPAIIDVDKEDFTLGWKAQEDEANTFKVTSNIQWRMTLKNEEDFEETTDKCDNLCGVIKEDFDMTDVPVSFRRTRNNLSLEDKVAEFKIEPVKLDKDGKEETLRSDVKSELTKTVRVSQDYLIFLLEKDDAVVDSGAGELPLGGFTELGKEGVETYSENINVEEHVVSQDFTVISEMDWTYASDALSQVGGELEELTSEEDSYDDRLVIKKTLRLHMHKPNPLRETFEYGLKLWAVEDEEAYRTVKVGQKPYQFDLTSKNVVYENIGGESTFTINTSGPWKMETSELEWISSVDPVQGFGPTEIKVVAEDRNLNFNDNVKNLKFVSELHQDLSETLEATQERFVFEVSEDDALKALSRLDTRQYDMRVTSSGPWKMEILDASESGNDWLGMSVLEEGKTEFAYEGQEAYAETIKVSARTKNPYEDQDRKVTVNIYSMLHADTEGDWKGQDKHSFTVTQERFRFDIQNSQNDDTEFSQADFVAYKSGTNSQKFYLKCSAKWMLESVPSWLKFDKESGDGEYLTLTMNAETNKSDAPRSATLKIKADVDEDGQYDDREGEITVTQAGFVFKVDSGNYDSAKAFGALNSTKDQKSVTVRITTTDEAGWDITCADWVGASKTSGTNTADLTFTPKDNSTKSARNASVVIRSKVTGQSSTISFSQDAYVFDETAKTFSTLFEEISSKNKAQEVDVTCTEGAGWTVNAPSWIKVTGTGTSEVTKGTGTTKLKITTKENNLSTTTDRTDYVIIKSDIGGYEKRVTVKQRKYTWSVSGMSDLTLDPDEDASQNISIQSSGNWTAEFDKQDSDFVSLSVASGVGNRLSTISTRLEVEKNYTQQKREAVLTIQSEHSANASNLKQQMRITQDRYVYEVSVPDMEFEADKDLTNTSVKGLKCTGDLEVSKPSSASWIKEVKISSSGTLTVTVEENEETKPREAKVTIQSEDYRATDSNRKKFQTVFTVKQKAAEVTEEK